MDFYITQLPEYPTILTRLKSGDALLDLGCCFGHIMRQIVFDGAPSENLTGTDLRPEFIELGYELFRDRAIFKSDFVTGDILDEDDEGLASLNGRFDVVHAAAFFHLFDWSTQVPRKDWREAGAVLQAWQKECIVSRQADWEPEAAEGETGRGKR